MYYILADSDEPESPPAIPHLSEARIELQHLIGKGGYGQVVKVKSLDPLQLFSTIFTILN